MGRPCAADLPHAAESLLVPYHSRTIAGQEIAVSGTISIHRWDHECETRPQGPWSTSVTHRHSGEAPGRDRRAQGARRRRRPQSRMLATVAWLELRSEV